MRLLVLVGIVLSTAASAQFRDSVPHPPHTFDEQLFFSINHWGDHAAWLDGPMVFLSNTAFVPVAGIPTTLFVLGHINDDKELAVAGFTTAAGLATSGLLGEILLKNIIRRPRPYHIIEDTRLITKGASGFSFPSGHTSSTFGLATGLSLHFPKWYVIIPSYLYATSVALSRPYLGAHYPTDLLAGAVLGIGMQFIWYELEKSYKDKWAIFPDAGPEPTATIVSLSLPL